MTLRVDASGQGGIAVTPSDSNKLQLKSGTLATKGIYVGVSGNLRCKMQDGSDVTFSGLAAGIIHPISAVQIYANGTTATSIIAVV